jgi:8-oxo-dGTP diphosphatase
VVAGEVRNHAWCPICRASHYDHPLVVVTSFVACGQKLLWIRRALEPRRGLWAIPGGFLEAGETMAQGAARELQEEAGVVLPAERLSLYMTGAITFINQVYVGLRAEVASEACSPGEESLECCFFSRDECPWEDTAYPQVNDSIMQAYKDIATGNFGIWQAEMTDSRYELREVCQTLPPT